MTAASTETLSNPRVVGDSRRDGAGGGRAWRILWDARVLLPLLAAFGGLLVAAAFTLVGWLEGGLTAWAVRLSGFALITALAALGLVLLRLYRRLLWPLAAVEESVGRVCQGEPGASLTLPRTGVLGGLLRDIRSLSDEVLDLYEDMDHRVARQTRRLAQKTASLKILYEVAASVNHAGNIDQLLLRYLRTLKEMVNGRTASVRLQDADGRSRLVGCIGLDNQVVLEHEMLPVTLCRCGRALTPGDILCEQDAQTCSERNGRHMFGRDEIECVEVPLEYQDRRLGGFLIYVEKPGIAGREDILELLETIGSHLGVAVAKQSSDAEARRLSIVEERNHLAHELHDSLAQTLASLRFQVRMLQETLEQDRGEGESVVQIQRIRNGLDEAHTELRELLNNFRAPVDQRGLIQALEKLADGFARDTGIHCFFQQDCRQLDLSAQEEMQLLRVVQESLANIRKHAQAHTVRVLLRCRAPGTYLLLVEDDGVGFERAPVLGGQAGEHIGLSIMEERARRVGAELRIESEPGEGTRVELTFTPGASLQAVRRGA